MSEDTGGRNWSWGLVAWVAVPAGLLVAVLAITLFSTPVTTRSGTDPNDQTGENELAAARTALGSSPDLGACKAAVQRLNAHLRQEPRHAVPQMPESERKALAEKLGLNEGDVAEMTATEFTPLDAYHLETCLLLRDVATSLDVTAPPGKDGKAARMTELELAEAAFDWTCRQVRLVPGEAERAPVLLTLRRGWGNHLERALVFVTLLEQFGLGGGERIRGCLVVAPRAGVPRVWCCGVAIGDKPDALRLFDMRMALPIPAGKTIATFTGLRADPSPLGQLKAGKLAYDISPEQARAAGLRIVCPLTVASPRMRLLQDVLLRERSWDGKPLPPPVSVRLAESPADAAAAFQSAAVGAAVAFLPGPAGSSMLRFDVSASEGGVDPGVEIAFRSLPGFTTPDDPRTQKLPRSSKLRLESVPWAYFPAELRDPKVLPFDFAFQQGIGFQLRNRFAWPFWSTLYDPSSAREQLLRGKVGKTTSEQLDNERSRWQNARQQRLTKEEREQGLPAWLERARAVDLALATAINDGSDPTRAMQEVAQLVAQPPMDTLLSIAVAEPRAADLTYQLGLCMHERAWRADRRHMLAARAGVDLPDEKERAMAAWEAAAGWWRDVAGSFPDDLSAPMARRLLGEALRRSGQKAAAREAWRGPSPRKTEMERLGDLWLEGRP